MAAKRVEKAAKRASRSKRRKQGVPRMPRRQAKVSSSLPVSTTKGQSMPSSRARARVAGALGLGPRLERDGGEPRARSQLSEIRDPNDIGALLLARDVG